MQRELQLQQQKQKQKQQQQRVAPLQDQFPLQFRSGQVYSQISPWASQ